MPFVPNVPGVPPLSSYIPNAIVPLIGDAIGLLLGALNIQTWGIFLDGIPVLSYDTMVSFGYSQDWEVSTYPVEGGFLTGSSFTAYDKVQKPSEIRVRLAAGEDVLNRQALLDTIDAQMSTTLTYDIVTPETVYLNYNFVRREYDRHAANVGIIAIDLFFVEIIQTSTAQFLDTASPVNAGQVGLGNVASPITPAQSQAAVTGQGIF